jgi:hypothetical protein
MDAANGIRALSQAHPTHKPEGTEKFETFKDRLDEVVEILRNNKNTCQKILQADDYIFKLAEAPVAYAKV